MENTVTSSTSKPHKTFILPWVLFILLLISTVIIILFATNVIGKTSNPNVKLFVGSAPSPDKLTETFTIVVQVTHVYEILADTDISFFMFFHDSDIDPTKYSLNTYKGKLSNFIYFIQKDQAAGMPKITLTYVPKSNEFDINMEDDVVKFSCTQKDSLDFLIAPSLPK